VPESLLPAQFQELEQWRAWSLATEPERSAKRQASTMDDIKAFYDAMLVRMEEVLPYLVATNLFGPFSRGCQVGESVSS
jgi:hypothetical protein